MLETYLPRERKTLVQLEKLFDDWHKALSKENYYEKNGLSPDCFIMDGIFPCFSTQKIKILYMGRESYDLEGMNYIDWHYNWIKAGKNNVKSPNQIATWRKLLKFTWGMLHGKEWDEIPNADLLRDIFASPSGFSLGMVNLSKISRPWNGSSKADWSLINGFINTSLATGENFQLGEIGIIKPDLIIAMNLLDYADERLFGARLEYVKHPNPDVAIFSLICDDARIPLLDTWHFASSKNERQMYESLCEAIGELDWRLFAP